MKTFLVSNRQSGKTHMAAYEFMKSPDDTLFIGCHPQDGKQFPFSKNYYKNIISQHKDSFRGLRGFKRAILDEYLFFRLPNRKFMHEQLSLIGIEEYIIFSTPSKVYYEEVFNFVIRMKSENIVFNNDNIREFITDFLKIKEAKPYISYDDIFEDIENLYFNYLTDVDTNVIYSSYFFNKNHDAISFLTPKQIETGADALLIK